MATVLFNLVSQGSGNNGSSIWIDLGLIPVGLDNWIGSLTVQGNKADSFYLYTNLAGKSVASASSCKLLASCSIKAGTTITQDLYKKGTLHTATVKGTGVEHWWLNITSKSATLAAYNYKILYTTE